MSEKNKDGRAKNGGVRSGAGRKAKEITAITSFRVHEESLNIIREVNYPLNTEVNKLVKQIAKKIQKQTIN
jgi:hypothetical protein